MTLDNINKMIELSEKKKEYLLKILELTRQQKTFIVKENMDSIEKILHSKEDLMKSIDLLDKNFLSLYNEVKKKEAIDNLNKIQANKYGNLKDLQDIIGKINKVLDEISILDQENTRIMKENLNNIKSDLKQVKEVKRAYKGYNYEMEASILIDEKK